jgi:hypothetical protein
MSGFNSRWLEIYPQRTKKSRGNNNKINKFFEKRPRLEYEVLYLLLVPAVVYALVPPPASHCVDSSLETGFVKGILEDVNAVVFHSTVVEAG